jgi:hypothetical protein
MRLASQSLSTNGFLAMRFDITEFGYESVAVPLFISGSHSFSL